MGMQPVYFSHIKCSRSGYQAYLWRKSFSRQVTSIFCMCIPRAHCIPRAPAKGAFSSSMRPCNLCSTCTPVPEAWSRSCTYAKHPWNAALIHICACRPVTRIARKGVCGTQRSRGWVREGAPAQRIYCFWSLSVALVRASHIINTSGSNLAPPMLWYSISTYSQTKLREFSFMPFMLYCTLQQWNCFNNDSDSSTVSGICGPSINSTV